MILINFWINIGKEKILTQISKSWNTRVQPAYTTSCIDVDFTIDTTKSSKHYSFGALKPQTSHLPVFASLFYTEIHAPIDIAFYGICHKNIFLIEPRKSPFFKKKVLRIWQFFHFFDRSYWYGIADFSNSGFFGLTDRAVLTKNGTPRDLSD